jgi:hypothetical protein
MRSTFLRSAATVALILPALVINADAQQKKNQGGGPPPAPHVAAPAPAPHIAAPAPAPHIAAPAPAAHIAAPAPAAHIAAPAAHIAAPQPHIAAEHIAPQNHAVAPQQQHIEARHLEPQQHTVTPQIVHPNVERGVARQNIAHENAAHQNAVQQNLAHEHEKNVAHGQTPTPNAANTRLANPGNTRDHKLPDAAAASREAPNKLSPGNASNQNLASPGRNGAAPNVIGQGPGKGGRNAANEQARAQIYAQNHKPVLHNQAFANLSPRDPATRALARADFRGRLAELNGFRDRDRFEQRRRFRGIVLGWVGPVFWPYAYDDFVDYTFYPYATDTFWPYAYDDVYDGIFGGYAPDWSAYASVPGRARGEATRRLASAGLPTAPGAPEVCSAQAPALTDWPIGQIAQQVQPDDNQRTLLDQLKDATAKAVNLLQSSCPTDLPSTPTGRMTELRQRIQTMLQAIQLVRPALDKFYQSLGDEQKERFNSLDISNSSGSQSARANTRQPDVTQVCSNRAAQATNLPSDRVAQLLQLDEAQRSALEQVKAASAKAGDLMNQNCAQSQPLTPTGRIAAMEQRLNAMLQALDTVQPALAKFYNSLSDEQRARFNRLPRQA